MILNTEEVENEKKAIWAVRSAPKNSGIHMDPVEFTSSADRAMAMRRWRKLHPTHTIWTFEFVSYV